jgi:tetratricopeptide (TPR) repeat protein
MLILSGGLPAGATPASAGARHAAIALILAILLGSSAEVSQAFLGHWSGAGVVPAAQQAPPWQQRLQIWLFAIERHQPGSADDAARLFASSSQAALTTLVGDLVSLGDLLARAHANPAGSEARSEITYADRQFTIAAVQQLLGLSEQEAKSGDLTRILKRGMLLHTDIAVLVPPDERPRIARPDVSVLRDGREDSVAYSQNAHWWVARILADALRPDPAQDPTVRQWYRAASAYLQGRGDLAAATAQLERARKLLPDDAEIWFYSGCVREALASPVVHLAVESIAPPPGRQRVAVESPESHLKAAATSFRRSLQLDPGLAEARVRLAHVAALLDDHDEAVRQLRQVATTAADRLVAYYASLLLGGEEEALNRRDEARTLYERAATLYPGAQSPLLALSHLAIRFGDREGALAAAQSVGRLPADAPERFDPWGVYYVAGGRRGEAMLEAWRQALVASTAR